MVHIFNGLRDAISKLTTGPRRGAGRPFQPGVLRPTAALLLAAVLVLASCSATGGVETPEPQQPADVAGGAGGEDPDIEEPVIRFGIVTQGEGDESRRGVQLALHRRDDRVAGIPIEVVVLTAPSNLTALAQAVEELISAQQVHGLIIDLDARRAAVAAAVAEAAATPSLYLGDPAGMPVPFGFAAAPTAADQGRALARHARQMGAEQAAVIYDVTSLPLRTLARAFAQAFIDLGGFVPTVDALSLSDPDASQASLTERLGGAAQKQPDVLLLALPGETAAPAVVAAAEAAAGIPLLGGTDWSRASLALAVQTARVELVYPVAFHSDRAADETAAFVAAYREAYAEEPSADAALAYDAAEMLAAAVEAAAAAGRFDPQDAAATRRAVTEALQDLQDFQGATGSYTATTDAGTRRSVLLLRLVPGSGEAEVRLAGEIVP